jgi:hypothetical protein
MARRCQQLGIKASAAEVACCEATAAMLHVTLHYHTAALLLPHSRRKLTGLTLLHRQQKIALWIGSPVNPGCETNLRTH